MTIRRCMPVIAGAVAIVLAWPAQAEFNPVVRWLMNQPVSLWDRGMERMEKGVDRAANDLGGLHSRGLIERLGIKYSGKSMVFYGSTDWNWENNEILISTGTVGFPFAASRPPKISDHKICNTVRQYFLSILTFNTWPFSILSPPSTPSPKEFTAEVHDTIRHWFSHVGYKSNSRDKELEAKLARRFFVEATISGQIGRYRYRGITCRARITEWDAPSKPYTLGKSAGR